MHLPGGYSELLLHLCGIEHANCYSRATMKRAHGEACSATLDIRKSHILSTHGRELWIYVV